MSSNFRAQLLYLLLLIGLAVCWTATASAPISYVDSGSIEDRVTTLERISNGQSKLLTQLQQQLSDNQRDIDSLRGQLQENQYQLNQINDRQKQIYQQINGLSNHGISAANSTVTGGSATATTSGDPTAVASSSVPASTGDENNDYNVAVSLALENKQYDQAIVALQNFVKQYPKSTYLANAHYWLGQLYYNKDKKDDAAYHYAVVVKNYPQSPKSADAMYKVGVIMQDKGQSDKARAVFQQVIKQYPNTETSKLAQKQLSN